MADLIFDFAVMEAGKSTQALQVVYNFRKNGLKVLVIKGCPKKIPDDPMYEYVTSRIPGIEPVKCDFLVTSKKSDWLFEKIKKMHEKEKYDLVLVEEAHFLGKKNVYDLLRIANVLDLSTRAFGIRSDFIGRPFIGSSYLFALADVVREFPNSAICEFSGKEIGFQKATKNLRYENGKLVLKGSAEAVNQESIQGLEVKTTYKIVCSRVFIEFMEDAGVEY